MPQDNGSNNPQTNPLPSQTGFHLPIINSSLHPNGVWDKKAYIRKLSKQAKEILDSLDLS